MDVTLRRLLGWDQPDPCLPTSTGAAEALPGAAGTWYFPPALRARRRGSGSRRSLGSRRMGWPRGSAA